MLRKASTTKQEQLVSELLAHNDIVQLNKLFNGRGTGKLVVSFPTAFARDQWFEKLRDVCLGKRGDAEPGSASTSNREVVLTGTFEKAARSTTGHYRGWRRRYFILHPRSIVYYTKPGGEQKGYMQVVGGSVRIMDPEELVTTSKGEQIYSNRLYCLEVEEGRDVSQTISAELYSEVRRIVRMAKIGKIEQLLQQGIRFKSARLLQRMLSVAHEMEVMLDFKLAFDAKQCLSELKEQSIIKELHLAKLHVPKRHDLEELIKLSKEYNIDLNLPSLVCIDALLKRSDIELELLRTNGQLVRNQLADFVRSMRKLNRLDWSQPSVQKHKHAFVLLFVRYVMRVLTDWLQLGRGRAEVHRALRRALLVCANYHVETESMDLMRLALQFGATVEVKDVDAVANGDREDSASAQEHGSRNMAEWEQPSASREFMKGVDTSNSSNGSSDMQSFIEELHVSHYVLSLTPQHALNKCPKLRDAYNLKKKRERGTFAMFIGQKKGVVIDELVHSVETLKTSLLEPDASSSLLHDAQLGSEVFCIVQVLMQDKPLSSLAKPSKSKIAKSTERSEINVLADLLTFLHSNSTGDIVDEVFFQICKQLTNNGDPLSRGKGWLLLSVLLHCIYPSLPCLPYIRYFVEEQVRTMKVAYISDNQKSNDHIAAQQSGVETLLYAMRAARYSLALLNQEGGSGQYQNVLSPQNEHFRLLLDCIWSQREIDIQVVAMTGQIAQLRLPFSQLSSPCVLLGLIYQTLVPLDAQIYYAHQQSSMVASSGAPNNESVDYIEEQLMQEYDVLFDINYQPPSRLSLAKSIKLSKRTHIPIYDDDVVIQEALLFSQGFALYRVDDTALDGDEHSVNVQRLAVQPFGSCLVNWHVDLQYEVLNSLVNSLVPDQHHIVSVTSTTSRTFVLRSVIMDPSVHHFSCDFELLGVEFGAYEYNPRLQALKQWLASDLMRYTKTADNAVVGRLDSLLLREKAGDRLLLPFDFFKLDLLFAEECRYVNSRLALLTDEHFHYLLSMQLALSWCDDTYRHTRTNVDGGDLQLVNNTASTASCYFTMPVKDIHRANAQRISRIKSVRDSLRREQGDEGVESLNTSDSDESDANSNPDEDEENEDEILSLQRKFHALQMGRSKYSPKRSNIRKRFSEGDSGDDSDPEAEGDAKRSDGQGDSWIPHPILPDQPLTKDDLQHLRQILEELGVEVADPTQAASSEGNAGTAQGKAYIDVLWQGMASFHAIVRESGLSIDSPFFRYLLKRSYHDYLTSVTGYYGMHFTEVSLTDLYLEDNLRFESSELTAFVDSFSAPQSVLLAISSYGLYLCDTETWSVQFYAPLFDVQHFELLSYGQHSAANSKARPHSAASQALLKLFISGLHISLVSKESDMKATVTCLEQHTLSALHVSCSLSEANWFSLAPVLDEETSVAALDSDEQMVVHRLAACTNVYKAPRVKTPSAAHSAMLQLFVQRYCPLLPAPRTMEVLPLALSTDSQRVFKPLLNNRQILLQQRLESLQRDLTLSSLATQSRYEKSQEHMHKRNELSKLGGGYSDDEDEEVESVKLLDADGVRDRNSVRKKRTARSVYGDPALTSQAKAGKVDADRVLSSIVGVMSHQGHRFRKREQDSGGGSYQHTGSLYMAANQASGNGTLVNIPVRTQGVVHVPSQHRSDQDSATRGHSKPRFSPFSPAKQMHAAKSLSYLPAQAAESTTSAGHTAAALQLERVDFVLAAYYEKTARDQAGQQRRRLADLAELEESLADGGTESLV
ncbi:hypothetical protein EON64_01640 [archaeon]|nr:MAG: hypothetical protein EON64_01640 [archaeon]